MSRIRLLLLSVLTFWLAVAGHAQQLPGTPPFGPKTKSTIQALVPVGYRARLAQIIAIAGQAPTAWITPRAAFSDSSQAVPAIDGGLAGYLLDVEGNPFDASQGTAANQPVFRATGLGGLPGLDYSSGGTKQTNGGTSLFAATGYTSGYTSYMVASATGYPATTSTILSYEDGQNFIAIDNSQILSSTANHHNNLPHNASDLSGVYVQAWDGTTVTYGINGCYKAFASAGTPPHQFTYVVGGLAGFSNLQWRNGCIGDILIFPGIHTKAQMDAISAVLAADSGLVKPCYMFIGDSITEGLNLSSPTEQCWPKQTLKLLGLDSSQVFYNNSAVPGWDLDQMIGDATAPGIGASYVSGVRGNLNVAIIFGGTNQMSLSGDNQSAAQAFAKLQTLCALYRSANCKVVVVTCLSRDATDGGASFDAKRLAFNALIRAAGATLYDGLVDVELDSRIGTAAALGTAYFQGDRVHLTKMGSAALAQDASPVLGSLGSASGYAVRSAPGPNLLQRTTVADVAYSITLNDYLVAYTSLSSGRTATLPSAVGISGQIVIVKDEAGSANSNNITIATSSSQTIDGAATKVISTAYGSVRLYSDGANWKTFGPGAVWTALGSLILAGKIRRRRARNNYAYSE